MSHLQMHYHSECLGRMVPVNVVLPIDAGTEDSGKRYRTLYLLHGLGGDCAEWCTQTAVRRLAEEADFAVVMPGGENGFYVDHPQRGRQYATFLSEELIRVTRRMFPLSDRREDTWIAGFSMGGFGALYNGMKYPQVFGRIAGFAPAIKFFEMRDFMMEHPEVAADYGYVGDLDTIMDTDRNLRNLARETAERKAAGQNVILPEIYMCAGNEDTLVPGIGTFAGFLRDLGFEVSTCVGEGAHTWEFCDRMLPAVLEFLLKDVEWK